jgi:hypothetical protein
MGLAGAKPLACQKRVKKRLPEKTQRKTQKKTRIYSRYDNGAEATGEVD